MAESLAQARMEREKVKPGRWAGLPPFQAYDFPSRTRESECDNGSRASVAILGRLEGRLEAA